MHRKAQCHTRISSIHFVLLIFYELFEYILTFTFNTIMYYIILTIYITEIDNKLDSQVLTEIKKKAGK